MEYGDAALNENVYCYDGTRFQVATGIFDVNTQSIVRLAEKPVSVADLTTSHYLRVVLECSAGQVAPQHVQISWFDKQLQRTSDVSLSLPSMGISPLVSGSDGYLCIYNPTNVPVVAAVEIYLPTSRCVDDGREVCAECNLQGAYFPSTQCVGAPGPVDYCLGADTFPSDHTFCEVCGDGAGYTTRITRTYYNWCYEEARIDAQSQAANCEILDGACG